MAAGPWSTHLKPAIAGKSRQAAEGESCDPHDRGDAVVSPWRSCVKPAHLFLHVLRFERLWRFGATVVVTVVYFAYRPSIDGSVHRFWHVLVDFEGVHSRPSYLGRFARRLISAPIINRLRYSQQELFEAADDMNKRATALSRAAEETVDIATIPK